MLVFGSCVFVQATDDEVVKEADTRVGVEFEKSDKLPDEITKPPKIDGGDNQTGYQILPRTGELLTSLVIILTGLSILIFSVGVLSIRQLYQTTSWEV
jgi:hypothetical protein